MSYLKDFTFSKFVLANWTNSPPSKLSTPYGISMANTLELENNRLIKDVLRKLNYSEEALILDLVVTKEEFSEWKRGKQIPESKKRMMREMVTAAKLFPPDGDFLESLRRIVEHRFEHLGDDKYTNVELTEEDTRFCAALNKVIKDLELEPLLFESHEDYAKKATRQGLVIEPFAKFVRAKGKGYTLNHDFLERFVEVSNTYLEFIQIKLQIETLSDLPCGKAHRIINAVLELTSHVLFQMYYSISLEKNFDLMTFYDRADEEIQELVHYVINTEGRLDLNYYELLSDWEEINSFVENYVMGDDYDSEDFSPRARVSQHFDLSIRTILESVDSLRKQQESINAVHEVLRENGLLFGQLVSLTQELERTKNALNEQKIKTVKIKDSLLESAKVFLKARGIAF